MSQIRNIRVWALSFSAVMMISGLAVGSASAAEWRLNGGKISIAVSAEESGTIELTDEAGGAFGEPVSVSCTYSKTGTAGPGVADMTSTVAVSACSTVSGTCGSPSATAVHLPWRTELVETLGLVRDKILNAGGGPPGYRFECTFFGIRASDTCTSETVMPKLVKNQSPVPVFYDLGSGATNCTRGGAGKGRFSGLANISSFAGTLTVG